MTDMSVNGHQLPDPSIRAEEDNVLNFKKPPCIVKCFVVVLTDFI